MATSGSLTNNYCFLLLWGTHSIWLWCWQSYSWMTGGWHVLVVALIMLIFLAGVGGEVGRKGNIQHRPFYLSRNLHSIILLPSLSKNYVVFFSPLSFYLSLRAIWATSSQNIKTSYGLISLMEILPNSNNDNNNLDFNALIFLILVGLKSCIKKKGHPSDLPVCIL